MNRAGLFSVGTKSQFLAQVARSPPLQALWAPQSGATVNCPESLPVVIASKAQVAARVARENPGTAGLVLKAKQGFAYGKELVRFYKSGVQNVWRNHTRVRSMAAHKYRLAGHVDRAGAAVAIKIPSFHVLTRHMAQRLYMDETENRTQREATAGDVVRSGGGGGVQPAGPLFAMTRAEYQLMRRTGGDFRKIPAFAVVFVVCMEMTPLVCYAFPQVAPSTCVLPSLLPRIWGPAAGRRLRTAISEGAVGAVADYAMKTAYNVPAAHARLLCDALNLKTPYLPAWAYPEFVLRQKLQNHFNYLAVDNYYLSGAAGAGNVWGLSVQELVVACLERNLVADSGRLAAVLAKGTDAEKAALEADLRVRLFRFVADFPNVNVGYLAVGHLLPAMDADMVKWRPQS